MARSSVVPGLEVSDRRSQVLAGRIWAGLVRVSFLLGLSSRHETERFNERQTHSTCGISVRSRHVTRQEDLTLYAIYNSLRSCMLHTQGRTLFI